MEHRQYQPSPITLIEPYLEAAIRMLHEDIWQFPDELQVELEFTRLALQPNGFASGFASTTITVAVDLYTDAHNKARKGDCKPDWN